MSPQNGAQLDWKPSCGSLPRIHHGAHHNQIRLFIVSTFSSPAALPFFKIG